MTNGNVQKVEIDPQDMRRITSAITEAIAKGVDKIVAAIHNSSMANNACEDKSDHGINKIVE